MLLFVLVKVPPLDQAWGLSNTITAAPMCRVKLQQRQSGSCPAPRREEDMGRRGLGQSEAVQHHWGTAGREECLGQEFMLSRILPLSLRNREQLSWREQNTTLPSLLFSLDFERLWPARFAVSCFHLCKQGEHSCTGKCCLAPISLRLFTSQLSWEQPLAVRAWLPASPQAPLGNCS